MKLVYIVSERNKSHVKIMVKGFRFTRRPVFQQVQDSGTGDDRADERPRGEGCIALPVGHSHRQLHLCAVQEPEPVVLGDGVRSLHGIVAQIVAITNDLASGELILEKNGAR